MIVGSYEILNCLSAVVLVTVMTILVETLVRSLGNFFFVGNLLVAGGRLTEMTLMKMLKMCADLLEAVQLL